MPSSFDRLLKLSDFRTKELTGTTASSANAAGVFRHAAKEVPAFWLPVEGAVYVPRQGLGPDTVDIRSTKTSEPFRVLLFFGT